MAALEGEEHGERTGQGGPDGRPAGAVGRQQLLAAGHGPPDRGRPAPQGDADRAERQGPFGFGVGPVGVVQGPAQQRLGLGVPAAPLTVLGDADAGAGDALVVARHGEQGERAAGHVGRGPVPGVEGGQGEPGMGGAQQVAGPVRRVERACQQFAAAHRFTAGDLRLAEAAGGLGGGGLARGRQVQALGEEVVGPRQVGACQGGRAGAGEQCGGAGPQYVGVVVVHPQFGEQTVGAGQMGADGRVTRLVPDEQPRGVLVPPGAYLLGHPSVGGLLHQGAAETEDGARGQGAAPCLDEPAPHEAAQQTGGGLRGAGVLGGGQFGQLGAAELASQDGGELQQGPFLGRQCVDAGAEQGVHGERQVVALGGHGGQVLQVQGIALGAVEGALERSLPVGRHFDQLTGESGGLLPRERGEHERRGTHPAATPAGVGLQQLGARGAHQGDRGAVELVQQPVDQVEQRRGRPVAVVEYEHHGPLTGERVQQAGQCHEGVVRRGAGCAVGEQTGPQQAQCLLRLRPLVGGQPCEPGVLPDGREHLAYRFGERGEGPGLAVRTAPALAVRRAVPEPLAQQARLAEARLAVDGHQVRTGVSRQFAQQQAEFGQFLLTADERGVEAADPLRVVLVQGDQSAGRDRDADALEGQ